MIKSPINYTGRKYKLLPQLLLPKCGTFVDMFSGSGDVFINVEADHHIVNDTQSEVIDLSRFLHATPLHYTYELINSLVVEYGLSKTNSTAYLKLRSDYNAGQRDPVSFFMLLAHSFSNQIRFSRHGFNMPFGKRTFNKTMQGNLDVWVDQLQTLDVKWSSVDFEAVDLGDADLVYLDPPYTCGVATYNTDWSDDARLFNYIDNLDTRWAMSNVFENNGVRNDQLIAWSKKYNVKFIKNSYVGSNYHRGNKGRTVEVLVTNYE